MPKIGVEQSLSDVQQALRNKGYEIKQLQKEQDGNECDCCVITGQDQNVMGMQTVSTQGSVINAHGMTAEEICQQVDQKFSQH